MRALIMLFAVMLWGLAPVPAADAHRVNIFAYVDGGVIRVECGFNRSQKVKQGRIEVVDAATGAPLVEGRTDDQGVFVFPVPAEARELGHDLRIRIIAAEGHQNDWVVSADELVSSSGAPSSGASADGAPADASASPAGSTAPTAVTGPPPAVKALTPAEAERIVNTALDARLAPIKRMLAEQYDAGPDLRDIIGGIGWIFGLIGVAAYFRRR